MPGSDQQWHRSPLALSQKAVYHLLAMNFPIVMFLGSWGIEARAINIILKNNQENSAPHGTCMNFVGIECPTPTLHCAKAAFDWLRGSEHSARTTLSGHGLNILFCFQLIWHIAVESDCPTSTVLDQMCNGSNIHTVIILCKVRWSIRMPSVTHCKLSQRTWCWWMPLQDGGKFHPHTVWTQGLVFWSLFQKQLHDHYGADTVLNYAICWGYWGL